jgi:glycosyltransferase involved in cell wall biosynthesis
MRVLHIAHNLFPTHAGGVEGYLWELARHQLQAGDQPRIYAGAPAPEHREQARSAEFPIWLAPPEVQREGLARFRASFQRAEVDRDLRARIREAEPEVIHLHHSAHLAYRPILEAAQQGIPLVVTVHDYWLYCQRLVLRRPDLRSCTGPVGGVRCAGCAGWRDGRPPGFFRRALQTPPFIYRTAVLGRLARAARRFILPGAFLRRLLPTGLFPPEKLEHIPYPVWPGEFPPPTPPEDERLRLGFIGSLRPHKGLHLLLKALQQLADPGWQLTVHGALPDDEYGRQLQELARDLPVTFAGPFPREDLRRVLSTIDLLVVPSLWPETGPMVIGEALAAGVPVVASSLGGCVELLGGARKGLLFAPGDPTDLLRILRQSVADPSRLEPFRQRRELPRFPEHVQALRACYAAASGGAA